MSSVGGCDAHDQTPFLRNGGHLHAVVGAEPDAPVLKLRFVKHGVIDPRLVFSPVNGAEMGPVTAAVLDDKCGNLIQIAQKN